MQPRDSIGVIAWTPEEIEENRLECFMRQNRKDMLTVLLTANATNPSALTARLAEAWQKARST